MDKKHLSFRISPEELEQLHFMATYEGRSANNFLLTLFRDAKKKFEKKHGKIEIGKK